MKINYNSNNKYIFYETEIKIALDWLYKIRDDEYNGWAWVQFIRPNEQNTAEVIYAFAENEAWLKANPECIEKILKSIDYWLFDTSHAKISIDYCWILRALQRVRKCETLYSRIDPVKLENAIHDCLAWLCENNCKASASVRGWGDNGNEISNVIRTSLAIMGLNEEIAYLTNRNGYILTDELNKYIQTVQGALNWLVSIQNPDGGWGNLDPNEITQDYQIVHSFSYSDLKYQCDSNAASTGYVMLALSSSGTNNYDPKIRRALNYLKSVQMKNGGWPVFTEIGVRDGERYTFRHFGTAWALQGIMTSGLGDFRDECVIHGFEYLSNLQDTNYGGWKSSPDADNYTWATCNALSTINMLKSDLSEVHAKHFLSIVWDWWTMKKKDTNHSFKIGNLTFAFNSTMALAFCIVFSIMITLSLAFTLNFVEPFLLNKPADIQKLTYSVITVLNAVILGLPWIVYVKNIFKQEVPGWIDSIGWVYGIITGFVLVLYQFIL